MGRLLQRLGSLSKFLFLLLSLLSCFSSLFGRLFQLLSSLLKLVSYLSIGSFCTFLNCRDFLGDLISLFGRNLSSCFHFLGSSLQNLLQVAGDLLGLLGLLFSHLTRSLSLGLLTGCRLR